MHDALYFGCWGHTGHSLWNTQARKIYDGPLWIRREVGRDLAPVLGPIDYSKPWSEQQPQSLARLHHLHGWTALAMWDRTVDTRGDANSVFVLRGTHTFARAAELAAASFPAVWRRISDAAPIRMQPIPATYTGQGYAVFVVTEGPSGQDTDPVTESGVQALRTPIADVSDPGGRRDLWVVAVLPTYQMARAVRVPVAESATPAEAFALADAAVVEALDA